MVTRFISPMISPNREMGRQTSVCRRLYRKADSRRLSGGHGDTFRYITARGWLGVLPTGTTIDEIRHLAQTGMR